MNAEAERGLRRFLGAGGGKGGASRFGTDDLQGLLLQVSFAVMMVFMLAYFLFRADASREREEQLLELERQKLVVAADAVRAARRARYGLSVLLPDGAGEGEDGPAPFDPAPGAILGLDAAYRDRPLLGAEAKVHDRPAVWARVRLDQPNVTRTGAKPGIRGTGFRVSGSASVVIRVLFLIDIPAAFL